jgi:zinc transport system substrate-binding protein
MHSIKPLMKARFLTFLLYCIVIVTLLVHCTTEQPAAMNITATTSLLGSIVQEIGKNYVIVTTIVPAGMCPGHFDISSQHIKNLADSKILFSHGWEQWIDKLLAAADRKPTLYPLNSVDNIMVPSVHKQTAEHVAAVLCSLDRAHSEQYMHNLRSYCSRIDSAVAIIKQEKARFASVKAACSELQEDFVRWLGIDIITTYPRAEDLTPAILEQVISASNQGTVILVIDNMQSGADAGRVIAEQINARRVVLTNFPLDDSYINALMDNFEKIRQALQ